MPVLTSYENAQADSWVHGTASTEDAEEARELAGIRAAFALLDSPA